jgi:hypothetical protein
MRCWSYQSRHPLHHLRHLQSSAIQRLIQLHPVAWCQRRFRAPALIVSVSRRPVTSRKLELGCGLECHSCAMNMGGMKRLLFYLQRGFDYFESCYLITSNISFLGFRLFYFSLRILFDI